jgi:hypothetical protein
MALPKKKIISSDMVETPLRGKIKNKKQRSFCLRTVFFYWGGLFIKPNALYNVQYVSAFFMFSGR